MYVLKLMNTRKDVSLMICLPYIFLYAVLNIELELNALIFHREGHPTCFELCLCSTAGYGWKTSQSS